MKKHNIFFTLLDETLVFAIHFSIMLLFPILSFCEFLPILERYTYKKAYPNEEVTIPSLTLNQKLTLPVVIPLALIVFSILFIPIFLYCIIKQIFKLCA